MAIGSINGANANSPVTNNIGSSRKLSDNAQNYLSELKEKYSDVNITVADFRSEKQFDSYIFGCSGGNNVAISASIAEKMASDPSYAAKYEKMIAEQPQHGKDLEKWAANNRQTIYGSGMYIDKDGNAKWWIIGGEMESRENPGTIYKEKVQKQLEEKRAERREKEALEKKHALVAETKEKLLEKMKETGQISDTSEVKTEAVKKKSNEEYLKNLHTKFSGMKFQLGYGISPKDEGNNDIYMLSVNPKLLEKMQNSPEAEKKYTQWIKDIERAMKLTDAYMKSRGRTAKWVNNYIDENEKYHHSSCWVYKDELNEKLRKEVQENMEKRIEETRNNAREKVEQLVESLDKKTKEAKETEKKQDISEVVSGTGTTAEKKIEDLLAEKLEYIENGEVYLGDKDAQMIIEATKKGKKSDIKAEVVVGSNLDLKI